MIEIIVILRGIELELIYVTEENFWESDYYTARKDELNNLMVKIRG